MSSSHLDTFEISRMVPDDLNAAFSLSSEIFATSSVLHSAMKLSIDDYREYIHESFHHMCKQGFSLVAKNPMTNDIIGCLIACDYAKQPKNLNPVPSLMEPVIAILEELEAPYIENRNILPGHYLLVDMAVVKPAARGQGVYKKMREKVHDFGRQSGFEYVVGELSSVATQHLCVNTFEHSVCSKIYFNSFEYNGRLPFKSIKEPKSIILVEGTLI